MPRIAWRRGGGLPLPQKAALRKAGGVLEVPDFQQEDAGSYECVAENSRGRNAARGRLTYYGELGASAGAGLTHSGCSPGSAAAAGDGQVQRDAGPGGFCSVFCRTRINAHQKRNWKTEFCGGAGGAGHAFCILK